MAGGEKPQNTPIQLAGVARDNRRGTQPRQGRNHQVTHGRLGFVQTARSGVLITVGGTSIKQKRHRGSTQNNLELGHA